MNLVKPEVLKLISSKQNPTDIIFRGIKVKDFISSKSWFNGTDFLSLPVNLRSHLSSGHQFSCVVSSKGKISGDNSSTRLTSVICNVNVSVNNTHMSSVIDVSKYDSLVKI